MLRIEPVIWFHTPRTGACLFSTVPVGGDARATRGIVRQPQHSSQNHSARLARSGR